MWKTVKGIQTLTLFLKNKNGVQKPKYKRGVTEKPNE